MFIAVNMDTPDNVLYVGKILSVKNKYLELIKLILQQLHEYKELYSELYESRQVKSSGLYKHNKTIMANNRAIKIL